MIQSTSIRLWRALRPVQTELDINLRHHLAIVAFVLLAGCGAASDSEHSSHSVDFVDHVEEWVEFTANEDDVRERWRLQQDHIDECMALRGFDYERPPQPESFGATRIPGWTFLLLSEEDAMDRGLGIVREPEPPTERLESTEQFQYAIELYGLGHHGEDGSVIGCAEDAVSSVGALSLEEAESYGLLEFDRDLELERFLRFVADDDVTTAAFRWSQCMAEAGMGATHSDPFSTYGLAETFWHDVVEPLDIGLTEESDLSVEQYDQLAGLEREYALAYVECLEPQRPLLAEKFNEIVGYEIPIEKEQ